MLLDRNYSKHVCYAAQPAFENYVVSRKQLLNECKPDLIRHHWRFFTTQTIGFSTFQDI